MKNYTGSVTEVSESMIADVTKILSSAEIYFAGKSASLKEVTKTIIFNNVLDFATVLEIEIPANTKTFCIRQAIKTNTVIIDDASKAALNEIFEASANLLDMINEEKKAAEKAEAERIAAKKAAEEKEIQEKKILAKARSAKKSTLENAKRLSELSFIKSNINNFYVELGYIVKHATNISAAMPDYLENWFISEFGDQKRKVVDTTRKTPSGLPPQFALALKIDLDSNDNMPAGLLNRLSTATTTRKARSIADTKYIFELCKEYGFKFGKEQDIDAIISKIPENMLDSFNLGCSLV